jgi:hypothetical protein
MNRGIDVLGPIVGRTFAARDRLTVGTLGVADCGASPADEVARDDGSPAIAAVAIAAVATAAFAVLAVAVNERLKRRSELETLAWWTSTASTFFPSTRASELMSAARMADSAAPPKDFDARVVYVIRPVGMLLRKTSLPLR